MTTGEKIRYLREVEGSLRGLERAMSQQELVRAIETETGSKLSQSYLSQIESGARPHLTNTTRRILAALCGGQMRRLFGCCLFALRPVRAIRRERHVFGGIAAAHSVSTQA